MNIKVGEYVRTKQGDIDKVILEYAGKCANPNCSAKHISCKSNYYDEEDIVNHSKNIIDLIEAGDYVNGYLVMRKPYVYCDVQFVMVDTQNSWNWGEGEMPADNIKSIVTKEQFENMEYRV